jgi:hypothetical protein
MNYKISAKVSGKGAISIYGLQRFPVTLYADQWLALLAKQPEILRFIEQNKASLASKSEAGAPAGSAAL